VTGVQTCALPIFAAGDSFNDTTMLGEADKGFFFHAPAGIRAQFPHFQAFDRYEDLLLAMKAEL
jgi:phosphoserine/homoserine phosphotransferase